MPLFFEKFIWFFVAAAVFLSGCSSHDPNPELKDPVYLDLISIVGNVSRDIASFETAITEETINRNKFEARSKDLALANKRLREAEEKLVRAKQALAYFEIKVERRRLEARLAYEKAFQRGESWPDPNEFRAYLANKDLKSANMHWSARVPRLQDRIDEFSKKGGQ
jgi:hypothetical protein